MRMNCAAIIITFACFGVGQSKADDSTSWGYGGCNLTATGGDSTAHASTTHGFKCKSTGACVSFRSVRDQVCDCCGAGQSCSACSDHSDEECMDGQIACDIGKCVNAVTFKSARKNQLSCRWDCIQQEFYDDCVKGRFPSVRNTQSFAIVCDRLAAHSPKDCANDACGTCLSSMLQYCSSAQYNVTCAGEVLAAGQTGVCGGQTGFVQACHDFCQQKHGSATADWSSCQGSSAKTVVCNCACVGAELPCVLQKTKQ